MLSMVKVPPLQGLRFTENTPTQGVALGWLIAALLGRKQLMRSFRTWRLGHRMSVQPNAITRIQPNTDNTAMKANTIAMRRTGIMVS